MFSDESDQEELDDNLDGSDFEFIEDSDEAPAEPLDRYKLIVCLRVHTIHKLYLSHFKKTYFDHVISISEVHLLITIIFYVFEFLPQCST